MQVFASVLQQRKLAHQVEPDGFRFTIPIAGEFKVGFFAYSLEGCFNLISELAPDPAEVEAVFLAVNEANLLNDATSHFHVIRKGGGEDGQAYLSLTTRTRMPASLNEFQTVGLLLDQALIEQWGTHNEIVQSAMREAQTQELVEGEPSLPPSPYPQLDG